MAADGLRAALDRNERQSSDLVATLKRVTARLSILEAAPPNEAVPPPPRSLDRSSGGGLNVAVARNEALVQDLLASLRSTLGDRGSTVLPAVRKMVLEPEPEPEPEPEEYGFIYRVVEKAQIRARFGGQSTRMGFLGVGTLVKPLEVRVNAKGQQRVRFVYVAGSNANPQSPLYNLERWTSVTAGDGTMQLERTQRGGGGS